MNIRSASSEGRQGMRPVRGSRHSVRPKRFSIYALPFLSAAVILVGALLATLFWLNRSPASHALAEVSFSVLGDADSRLSPPEARQALLSLPVQTLLQSGTGHEEHWLRLMIPPAQANMGSVLQLDSKRLASASCHDGKGLLLGVARRDSRSGLMSEFLSGFQLRLRADLTEVVCKISFTGPSRFRAAFWSASQAAEAHLYFQESAGAVDGATLTLAFFAVVVGLFNQSLTPVIYAAWLVVNARLASLSMGMDYQWMSWPIPVAYLPWMREGLVVSYIVLSLALVQVMFKREIRHLKLHHPVRHASAAFMAAACLAYVLPGPYPLAFTLLLGLLSGLFIIWVMTRTLGAAPSLAGWTCALGWLLSFIGEFAEALTQTLGNAHPAWLDHPITVAVISTTLVAAAIAIQVQGDRAARIRERMMTVNALKLVNRTYQNVPIGLFTVGPDGEFIRFNPGFESMLGLKSGAKARHWRDCFPDISLLDIMPRAVAQGATIEKDRHTYRISAVAVKEAFECTVTDVTNEANNVAKLSHLVDHDELTGALNRRGLNAWADHANRDRRWGTAMTFASVDLQRFKLINDLFGYSTGDAVLTETVRRMERQVHKEGVWIARLGGDQFLMIFERWTDSEVRAIAARIVDEISNKSFDIKDNRVSVGVNIGLIHVDRSLTLAEALAAADYACTLAKTSKTHVHWEVANPRQIEAYRAEQKLARSFEEHLPVERLALEFQPIISLTRPSQNLTAEALIRMRSESGKLIAPGVFLPLAERQGFMSQIDWWVLTNTTDWFTRHPESASSFNYMAINLSGASLNDEGFLEKVSDFMQDHRWLADKILFEITESIALRDMATTTKFVERMKALGVRIGLDDFGAGYTSFSYLQAFPADVLKLDGSFVREASKSPQNLRIIRSIIDLTHQLEMSCVAEWAENADLVRILCEQGADYAQGWGLSKALEPKAFIGVSNGLQLVEDPAVRDYLLTLESAA